MAASVVRLWNTLTTSAKTGTSGYQSAAEFNYDLASVQTALLSLLAPMYAKNTYVQELLAPFVKSVTVSLTKPAECAYFLGATINGIAAYPIQPEQAPIYASSPIRAPSTKNPSAYWYIINNTLTYINSGSLAGTMQYIRYPLASTIVLTPTSTPNRDYVTPTAGVELEWPELAFNLLLAMMQERLGLELKEDILTMVGNQSLQKEVANT